LPYAVGKRERPPVITPLVTASRGTGGVEEDSVASTNIKQTEIELKLDQTKILDKTSEKLGTDSLLYVTDSLPANDLNKIFLVDVDDETGDEIELVEDEADVKEENCKRIMLSIFSCSNFDSSAETDTKDVTEVERLKLWRPRNVPLLTQQLTQRRTFCGNNGMEEPTEVVKVPVEISIFGEKIKGIIDSGSERSYLSKGAYERVKSLRVNDIVPDSTSTAGVCLGDNSLVKTEGGVCFVIDIGDIYGPQWFSILSGLSGDLILGMDFWLSFKVILDPHKKAWTLSGSQYSYPLSYRLVFPAELKALSIDQSQKLKEFLNNEFAKFDTESLGVTDLIKHVIELDDLIPHRQKPYRRSEAVRIFINEEVDRLLSRGYLTWSNSNWASSPVVAPKANGRLRFCIDYRMLNRKTKKPAYPLPQMGSILSQLHHAKIISTLDMSEAFHQIPMDEESRKYTAFVVEGKGLLEWLRMPYGLTGAPSTFQRLMDSLKRRVGEIIIERKLPNQWVDQVFAYLDDWVVVSRDLDEHLSLLSILFEVLREAKLIINREKSSFACKEVKFLGYIVDESGMRPNPEKIQPILDYPVPKDRTQLRQFNGLVNWYHRHLKNIARVQGPLNKLTSPKVPWRWSKVEQNAFDEVKQALAAAPKLHVPIPGQSFILYTDASDFGLGAILVQQDPDSDKELLIEVLSRPLRGAEFHYTTTEKECLAVVWAVGKLRCYLEGMPFKVVTDHRALLWLYGLKNPVGRLARWAIYLLQHNITIE